MPFSLAAAARAALLAALLAAGTTAAAAPATASLASTWDYLGPFPVAKTELDGDPAAAIVALHDVRRRKARLQQPLVSELVPGGNVSWVTLRADAAGAVAVAAPASVDWNRLVQQLSDIAVLETQGWAVAALRVGSSAATARVRVRLCCEGAVAAFVAADGEAGPPVQISGDIYGTG